MASVTRDVSLDVTQFNHIRNIVVKQNDYNSRFLKVTLLDSEVPFQVPTTSTAIINARRVDDSSASYRGTVNADGTVTVPLTAWMLALVGIVNCSVSVIGDDAKLTSMTFSLDVQAQENPDDNIEEDENVPILVQLISDVGELQSDYESLLTNKLIKSVEYNSTNYSVVFTLVDGKGKESTFETGNIRGPVGPKGEKGDATLPTYTLEWFNEPTAEQIAANAEIINTVSSLTPGSYEIRLKIGSAYLPALYVSDLTVIGLSLQDGVSLRAYQFYGRTSATYRQETWSYIETNTFDATSSAAASQEVIAAYVEGKQAAVGTLLLPSAGWTDNSDGTFSQTVTISGANTSSMINLQPSAATLIQMENDGTTGLYVENNAGTLTAVAIGEAPSADISVQYTIQEVLI